LKLGALRIKLIRIMKNEMKEIKRSGIKKILVLGSTGSIGRQTLDVIRSHPNKFKIVGLACNANMTLLKEQIREFKPKFVSIGQESKLQSDSVKIFYGEKGLLKLIHEADCDLVVLAIVGAAGLRPAIEVIHAGKSIALATKEVMVLAGKLINEEIKNKNAQLQKKDKPLIRLFPIDSEHSAIWQSLHSGQPKEIEKIFLTCSGGPFRNKTIKELQGLTAEDALRHPTWNMGKRITIDCSTLMNKGLEVIEAKWLFDIQASQIEVVIHPQSILHSAVMFQDGSVIGQFNLPDMRIPIQYALSYPERIKNSFPRMSFVQIKTLTFDKPDMEKFPCLKYGFKAASEGGTLPVVINAADEIAVKLFLDKKIKFTDIAKIIKKTMDKHRNIKNPTLEKILETDAWARETARMIFGNLTTN
jgi:1-deoxy-D-xylulose-5-phosphate reductoisomerase